MLKKNSANEKKLRKITDNKKKNEKNNYFLFTGIDKNKKNNVKNIH